MVHKKTVLGKGLSALIPDLPQFSPLSKVLTCGIEQIRPSPHQPRKSFSDESLNELAASISQNGILQPLLVRKVSDDGYELIAGERRWRAAQLASLHEVPIIVMHADAGESLQLSLIENIQRDDLNPLELAAAYRMLIDTLQLSHEDLSQKLGKKRSTITNILRLSQLPEAVQKELRSGAISLGHAKALLACDNPQTQLLVCTMILKKDLSVRQTERLIKTLNNQNKKPSHAPSAAPVYHHAQSELTAIFQTRVRILAQGRSKRIQIDFYTDDDLTRILDIIKKGISP